MQIEMDDVVHVIFLGPSDLLLTRVDPNKYNKLFLMEGGKPVI